MFFNYHNKRELTCLYKNTQHATVLSSSYIIQNILWRKGNIHKFSFLGLSKNGMNNKSCLLNRFPWFISLTLHIHPSNIIWVYPEFLERLIEWESEWNILGIQWNAWFSFSIRIFSNMKYTFVHWLSSFFSVYFGLSMHFLMLI